MSFICLKEQRDAISMQYQPYKALLINPQEYVTEMHGGHHIISQLAKSKKDPFFFLATNAIEADLQSFQFFNRIISFYGSFSRDSLFQCSVRPWIKSLIAPKNIWHWNMSILSQKNLVKIYYWIWFFFQPSISTH